MQCLQVQLPGEASGVERLKLASPLPRVLVGWFCSLVLSGWVAREHDASTAPPLPPHNVKLFDPHCAGSEVFE